MIGGLVSGVGLLEVSGTVFVGLCLWGWFCSHWEHEAFLTRPLRSSHGTVVSKGGNLAIIIPVFDSWL